MTLGEGAGSSLTSVPPHPLPPPPHPSPFPSLLDVRHLRSSLKTVGACLSFLRGQKGAFARPKGPSGGQVAPEPQDVDVWAHFFLPLCPCSFHDSFSSLPKDASCPLALPFRPLPLSSQSPSPPQSRAGRCYWCFFTSGPSSVFVFSASPLPDLLQSLSTPPSSGSRGWLGEGHLPPTQLKMLHPTWPQGCWQKDEKNPAIFQSHANWPI